MVGEEVCLSFFITLLACVLLLNQTGIAFVSIVCSVVWNLSLCKASVVMCRSNATLRRHWCWGTIWQLIYTHLCADISSYTVVHNCLIPLCYASVAPFRTVTSIGLCCESTCGLHCAWCLLQCLSRVICMLALGIRNGASVHQQWDIIFNVLLSSVSLFMPPSFLCPMMTHTKYI